MASVSGSLRQSSPPKPKLAEAKLAEAKLPGQRVIRQSLLGPTQIRPDRHPS
jgi:hypothetical protein